MTITPIHPDDAAPAESGHPPTSTTVSRRTLGFRKYARRTLGVRKYGARRALGYRGPSRRTLGRRVAPSRRTLMPRAKF